MTTVQRLTGLALIALAATAAAQTDRGAPNLGYLYPAGGQQGETFEVMIGGQNLRGSHGVYVTGEGVEASVKKFYGRFRLDGEQSRALWKEIERLWKLRREEMAEKPEEPAPAAPPEGSGSDAQPEEGSGSDTPAKDSDTETNPLEDGKDAIPPESMEVKLPDHPLINNLEDRSLRELAYVRSEFRNYRKRQQNAQIAETMVIEVAIAPDAAPGDRELRIRTPQGITNPIRFKVGSLPEMNEVELNDPVIRFPLPKEPSIATPVVLNGQILPGDVDRYRIEGKQGQDLVFRADARSLNPFLADAVPGWFQATLALYDGKGNEVAFADDYRYSPDPVMHYRIPKDGIYELEIRDSIYRGREDFVYRVTIGEHPFITQVFPLGGGEGQKVEVAINGWNLPEKTLALDTSPGPERVRKANLPGETATRIAYAVDTLPETRDKEPKDDTPQAISLPVIVNGRVNKPGDVDTFSFDGKAGDEVVAEVSARKLGSPLDGQLKILTPSGEVLAFNDDFVQKDGHLHTRGDVLTHDADPYLSVTLPEDGVYKVALADTQGQGGGACAYRLRIGPPRPGYEVRVTPSSLSIQAGRATVVTAHVQRRDGFDGPIDLALKDAPEGFALVGGRIPAGCDRIRMTLTAPSEPAYEAIPLTFESTAEIGDRIVTRDAVPADDRMQAFLWRHLVPAQTGMAVVTGPKFKGRPIAWTKSGPVTIPEGGATRVVIQVPKFPQIEQVRLELDDAPAGLSIGDIEVVPQGIACNLIADAVDSPLTDNLIVAAFLEQNDGKVKRTGGGRRSPAGILPAIPIQVVP